MVEEGEHVVANNLYKSVQAGSDSAVLSTYDSGLAGED